MTDKTKSVKKEKLLKEYAKLAKKLKKSPRLADLVDAGYTKDMVGHHFQSLSRLDEEARKAYPDNFYNVTIDCLLNPKATQDLRDTVKGFKRFVITTAVTGCKVDMNFYKSIKTYCKIKDAALLILVASDPAHRDQHCDRGSIDKILANECVVIEDTKLNSNLFISTIKLSAKHIDPITGLSRIGQRNGSFIYASPKQRLKATPIANKKLPHFLMTTGAITLPDYNTDVYMSERTAYIADHDHKMGAIIVEVEDDNTYYFTQIQADEDGSFIDWGIKYDDDLTYPVTPDAFVLGDVHVLETDPVVERCWMSIVDELKPKTIVAHDMFSGLSVNHHEQNNMILKAQRASKGQLSLEKELRSVSKKISEYAAKAEVVLVKSNHDEFLERYLREGLYVNDPHNHHISLKLALAMLEGNDPLKFGIELMNGAPINRVRWLSRDEDFRIARIQLGAHGDQGCNGTKGSLVAMENAYANSVSGHSHTPEILRGAWAVGTSTFLKLEYNRGPSSWMHTSCLIYPNGSRQLINVIKGKYRL